MIKAILFDLEGTLIRVDTNNFMRNYLGLLAPRFAHFLSPDKFSKQLLKSWEFAQRESGPEQTVMQSFYEDLSKAMGHSSQILQPVFEEFYEADFPTLKCLVQVVPQGVRIVNHALQRGFLTGVASNPDMPLEAMREYLSWAGLKPKQFKVIPAMDSFHYFKPQREYFQELAEKLGLKPENCLLVCSQTQDLVCRKIGMKVFLTGAPETAEEADYTGSFDDLFRLLG